MRFLGKPLTRTKRKEVAPIADLERPLSQDERDLLKFVLAHTTPDAALFLDQVEETVVNGTCRCGCPTIHLKAPDRKEEVWPGPNPLVDLYGTTQDGRFVGLLVFATRRQLSCLEVYNLSESEEPWGLPTIASLESRDGKKLAAVMNDA